MVLNRSLIARESSWYWYCDWTAASVSWRRSTLLPLAPTGVSVGEVCTWTPSRSPRSTLPSSTAWRSEDSKSTLVARYPGVSTLEMLSAVTC